MAWFILARVLFMLAVTYAAVLAPAVRSRRSRVNLAIGAALGLLDRLVEIAAPRPRRSPTCSAR